MHIVKKATKTQIDGAVKRVREATEPKCYFCGKPCDKEDYCFGCGEYVCSNCDETSPFGSHDVEEHRIS